MLSIARSRLALPIQFAFLIVNALALLLGVVYNHKSPELYENNAHSKTGWIITWIASAWVFMGLVQIHAGRTKADALNNETAQPMTAANMAQYESLHKSQLPDPSRYSSDSGQGTEPNSASLYGHSRSPSVEEEEHVFLGPQRRFTHDDDEAFENGAEKDSFLRNTPVDGFFSRTIGRYAVGRPLKFLRLLYVVIDRTILVQGFVAFATGTVVYGGIGVSKAHTSMNCIC
jgi:hypothetical protein